MKLLRLLLGLTVLALVVAAGVFFSSNTPAQSSSTNAALSFTYTVSNRTFTFTAAGGFTNYVWDFGDSSTGTGATVSHTYYGNGKYTVTLRADPVTGSSAPLSTFQEIIVNTVTSVVHNYFVNLNITMGSTAH